MTRTVEGLVCREGRVARWVEQGNDEDQPGPEISCSSRGYSLSYYIQTPERAIPGGVNLLYKSSGSKQCKGWTVVDAVVCVLEPSSEWKKGSFS